MQSCDYSAIGHLAHALFLGAADSEPEKCWFAMAVAEEWTGYFDDTGSEDGSPLVSLVGFVGTVDQWLAFERDWNIVLRLPQFDLEYFHMKELRQGKGRFAKFTNNLPLQTDLFDRLQRVIKIRVRDTFAATVVVSDFRKLDLEYGITESEFGSPLLVAAQTAIGKLVTLQQRSYPDVKLKVVVDQGIKHWGKLDESMLRNSGSRLIPGVPKELPPLQACDLVAWELNRALTTSFVTETVTSWNGLRGSFKAFVKRFPSPKWFWVDESQMRRTFDASPDLIQKRALAQPTRDEGQQ